MRNRFAKLGKKRTAALTLAFSCLALPVSAQQAETEEGSVIAPAVTREVLVTASRTEQELKETPASAEIITREDIETLGAQTVQDALKLAVGVELPKGTVGGSEVNIRGMYAQHTLVLVNGRRMGGEDGGTMGGRFDLNRINIHNVERIEIIRGPGSSLYGSDALGGVINIITRRSETPEFRLNMGTGSDEQNLGFNYDLGQDGKWNWTVGANFVKTRQRGELDVNSGVSILPYGSREYYNIEGTYDLTETKKIDLFFERTQEHPRYFGANSTTRTYSQDRYNGYRNSYGITYRGTASSSNYEIRAYATELERYNNKFSAAGATTGTDYRKFNNWIIDGKNSLQLDDKHLLTIGGELRFVEYKATNLNNDAKIAGSLVQNNGNLATIRKKTTDYRSFYLQDEWLVSEKFLLIPSVRYDYSSDFGDHFSPKIGMNYKFTENYRLKINYGKGFRAPSLSEMYMSSPMGGMVNFISNPDLKPEQAISYDVSFEADLGKTSAKVTYFNNNFKNYIGMSNISGTTYTYENISKAKIQGVELELSQELNANFDLRAVYTGLNAKNRETSAHLTSRADDVFSLQLHYHDNKPNGINAILWYDFKDDYRRTASDIYSYGTLNFTFNKKFTDKVSAYFGVDNIFDKKVDLLYDYGISWRVGVNFTI